MAAWKRTSNRLTQRLQAHRTFLVRGHVTTRWAGLCWRARLLRSHRMRISIDLHSLSVINRHTKPFVFPGLPVKLLAGLAAVEDKLTSRAGLEQQIQAVAGADTAVGALSLVA